MTKAIADVTRPYGIETIVSLNPIMVDGTGMCGGCRVIVDGESKFACVDGPDFYAHKADFNNLTDRNRMYYKHESKSLEEFNHKCKLDAQAEALENR